MKVIINLVKLQVNMNKRFHQGSFHFIKEVEKEN